MPTTTKPPQPPVAPAASAFTPTLDYRSPGTGTPRVQRIVRELAVAESLGGAAIALKVAFGVPLSLMGPLVITSLGVGIDRRMQTDFLPGFGLTFLLVTAAMVPLLMWLERRSRGEFLVESLRGETSPLAASSYGEYELQSTKFGWIAWTEVALTGPRLLWETIDALRGRAPVNDALRVAAAEVVVELLDAGEGLPLRQLARPGRDGRALLATVDYLVRRQWADVSSRRDRVWLATPVRERLRGI